MLNSTDPASLKGKGAETMLPERGNPFGGEPFAEMPAALPTDEAPAFTAMMEEPTAPEAQLALAAVDVVSIAEAAPVAETPTPASVLAAETAPVAEAGPAATLGESAGVRVTAAGGAAVTLSQDIGPSTEKYVPMATALTADEALVGLFVPDDRMMVLWLEIDDLEKRIAAQPGVSEKVAGEFFDRLKTARNLLMHNRDQYEEANREVAQVRYRLAQIGRSGPSQNARVILVYLLVILVVLVLNFVSSGSIVASVQNGLASFAGVRDYFNELMWFTILWGGTGGLTGAMYSLWRHVAAERDYDPQFALWYYTNPIMGVVLGAFVYILVNMVVLLAQGLPGAISTQTAPQSTTAATTEISPYLMYFFAWVVGFQQNFVFRLVDQVLKQVMPSDKDKEKK